MIEEMKVNFKSRGCRRKLVEAGTLWNIFNTISSKLCKGRHFSTPISTRRKVAEYQMTTIRNKKGYEEAVIDEIEKTAAKSK
jgi:hypothetical protein